MNIIKNIAIGFVGLFIGAVVVFGVIIGMNTLLPNFMSISKSTIYVLEVTSALIIGITAIFGIKRRLKQRGHTNF